MISGVTTTTQANGTWYFEAYDPDAIMLFTDSTYATPVDASGWTLYQTSQAGQDLNGAGNNYVLIDPVAYPDLIANVQVGWTASDGSANYAVTTITPDYQSGYTLYLMSGGNFASNSTVTFFSPVNGNISITIETPSPTVTINAGGFETVFTNYGNVVLPSIAEANVSSLASPFNNDLVLYAGSSNLFTFGANSQLTLPGGIHMPGTIQWNGGSQVYEDSDIIISSPQGVGLTSPNTTTINAGSFNWNFDNTGNLTLPGGINSTNGIPINSTQSINALVNGVTGVEITTGTVGIYADNILSLQLDGSNSDFRNQNIINASTLQVNNSANVLSLTTRNGDSNPVYSAAQITMGYAGTTDYAQWIHTRHNGGSSQYNTIEFYTNDGTQNAVFPANAILGLTVNGGNVGVGNVLNPGNVLDVSGNVWANGSITATSFIGNGSQLTNLPPTALSTRATAVGPGGNLYITPTDGFVLVNRNGQTTVNIIIDNTTPIGHQFIIKESSGFSTALTVQSDDTANVLTDGQTSVSIGSNVRNSVTVVVASADGGSGKGLWIIGQFHD